MKQKIILAVVLIISILTWQCSKEQNDLGEVKSLKESINNSAQSLNIAVSEISKTLGYQILKINDNSTDKSLSFKSSDFQDSVTLEKIAGIYEYKPFHSDNRCSWNYSKLFQKTDSSNLLIVKLPSEKIFTPWKFRSISKSDTVLENNFVITASDYHYYYSHGCLRDYKLVADVTISDTAIGNIAIESKKDLESGFNYASDYTFANGYSIEVKKSSGDTATSSIALSDASSVLFKESVTRIKSSGHKYCEKQYILDIGNVEIRRTSASDSTSIYVDGVLQVNAKVEFIETENDGEEGGMCKKHDRDIKITFDDGTTTTISELLGPTLTLLQDMALSLESVYFATHIVDYVAFNIFYHKH